MKKVILVKHSAPEIVPDIPSHEWKLSQQGKDRCKPLADVLRPHEPTTIIASEEPKATETGQILAEQLALPFATAHDLFEHDRSNVPHMNGAEFQSAVALFFQRSEDLVLGEETAEEAAGRFDAAVREVLENQKEGTPIIVSHGTVITLLVARYNRNIRPYTFWRRLRLPSVVVLAQSNFELLEVVDQV